MVIGAYRSSTIFFLAMYGQGSEAQAGIINRALGFVSSVTGGQGNAASAVRSVVSGGLERNAGGIYDWVAGLLFQDM